MKTVLRIAKLKTPGNIGGLNAHNTRAMDVPNADPDLRKYNQVLVGSSDLNKDVQDRLDSAGISKVRKNGVLAIEHVISASPEFFDAKKRGSGADAYLDFRDHNQVSEFFISSKEFLEEHYGQENLVNFTIHFDEKTPHAHAVVVPITSEGKLTAKEFTGTRAKLSNLQTTFAEKVQHLGIERGREGSKASHQTVKEFYSKLEEVNKEIKAMEKIADEKHLKVKVYTPPEREKVLGGFKNKLTDEEYSETVKQEVMAHSKAVAKDVEAFTQQKINQMWGYTERIAKISVEKRNQQREINQLKKEVKKLRQAENGLMAHHQKEVNIYKSEISKLKDENKGLVAQINSLRNQFEGYKQQAEQAFRTLKEKSKKYLNLLADRVKTEGLIFRKMQMNNLNKSDISKAFGGNADLDNDVKRWQKDEGIRSDRDRSF